MTTETKKSPKVTFDCCLESLAAMYSTVLLIDLSTHQCLGHFSLLVTCAAMTDCCSFKEAMRWSIFWRSFKSLMCSLQN